MSTSDDLTGLDAWWAQFLARLSVEYAAALDESAALALRRQAATPPARAYGPHDPDTAQEFVQVLRLRPGTVRSWETVGVPVPERLRRQRAVLNTLAWKRGADRGDR